MFRDEKYKKQKDDQGCDFKSTPTGLDGSNVAVKRSVVRWTKLDVMRDGKKKQ